MHLSFRLPDFYKTKQASSLELLFFKTFRLYSLSVDLLTAIDFVNNLL